MARKVELTLPKLKYAFDALEPTISAKIMQLHYEKHHKGYVDKANELLNELENINRLTEQPIDDVMDLQYYIDSFSDNIRNNVGGHYNHSLFWETVAPDSKGVPKKLIPDYAIYEDLVDRYGSIKEFEESFVQKALGHFGSGWVWLVDSKAGLQITTTLNQDNPAMSRTDGMYTEGVVLFGIDLWEHAYYLQYENRKEEYVKAVLDIINWEVVEERYLYSSGFNFETESIWQDR